VDSGLGKDALRVSSAVGLVGVKADRYTRSSTTLNTVVERPPINLLALAAMASKTGCTSDGELAMILRISAVAIRCSSASSRSEVRSASLRSSSTIV
jgi:hypothetical protein